MAHIHMVKNRKLLKLRQFLTARCCNRVLRTARRTPALLSPQGCALGRSGAGQGGVLHRRAIVPTRFGGVGAWRKRSNSAVFLRSRDRGSEDAVVFPEIGMD